MADTRGVVNEPPAKPPDCTTPAAADASPSRLAVPTLADSPQKPSGTTKPRHASLNSTGLGPANSAMTTSASGSSRFMHRLRHFTKRVMDSYTFKFLISFSLFVALFGNPIWTLFRVPDDPGNVVLDAIMITVTFMFIADIVVNTLCDRHNYPWSFFFWMDIVGTLSMIFEISFLTPIKVGESSSADTVVLRAARTAKVGARAGRFAKLLKCLSVVHARRNRGLENDIKQGKGTRDAKAISNKLMIILSTKVSMLTIGMVLVTPLFEIGAFPETDMSMRTWGMTLEKTYIQAYEKLAATPSLVSTNLFKEKVDSMVSFYRDKPYFPYKLEGFPEYVNIDGQQKQILGGVSSIGTEPVKEVSTFKVEVKSCLLARIGCSGDNKAMIYFNFETPKHLEAGMDIMMLCFIIFVMICMSFHLNSVLNVLVVGPMERMLGTLRKQTTSILQQMKGLKPKKVEEEDELSDSSGEELSTTEMDIIETSLMKIVKIVQISMRTNALDDEAMANMGSEEKGVLMDMMQMGGAPDSPTQVRPKKMSGTYEIAASSLSSEIASQLEDADSWDLDFLVLGPSEQEQVLLHLLFDSDLGNNSARSLTDIETFRNFHGHVFNGYADQPYHNYTHACDVLFTVHRLLVITSAKEWVDDVGLYAMLIASLCHDLGHQGMTNPFLVESRHELALRYNDKSPLENMHCATMFDICTHEDSNVFSKLAKDQYKRVRKVCINAILHTDNAHHFETVKKIKRVAEMNIEVCEAQAADSDILQQYRAEVLDHDQQLWLGLFLHFADISNPLKPFKICHAWAQRILDEFFAQGDEEKRLGYPVGMLNDRDKINRPGSQHGFINFLVAPFVLATIQLFPKMHTLSTAMAQNLRIWRDVWVEDVHPPQEDIDKRDADVKRIATEAATLAARVCPQGWVKQTS